MAKLRTAVVGLGYWGPNLARNVASSSAFELTALVDLDATRRERLSAMHAGTKTYETLRQAIDDQAIDFVVVATPVASHEALAVEALQAGCHVLVEKPFASTVAGARRILAEAEKADRQVFVDHVFLFTPIVAEIRKRVLAGEFGDLLTVESTRINLGLFQPDVDVIWDLAPHDLSILSGVLDALPVAVRAIGQSNNPRDFADNAHLHLEYASGLQAHVHVSWLSPVKVRRMIFAGKKKFAIYDDLEPAEKLKIYDHGVEFDVRNPDAKREVLVSYRRGDMLAPHVAPKEALAVQLEHIGQVILHGAKAIAPGHQGAAVSAVLEAAHDSLKHGGDRVSTHEYLVGLDDR